MSPEQARGREGDRRSDIWAFGAVLFEMLSGERAFTGGDVPETIAAVTGGEIAWRRVPSNTPPALSQLLTRCLDRDPTRRLRDIGEARIVLDDLIDGTAGTATITASAGPAASTLFLSAAVASVAVGIVAIALWPRPSPPPSPVTRFVLPLPADRQLLVDPQTRDLSITRDGSRIVYQGGVPHRSHAALRPSLRSARSGTVDTNGPAEGAIRVSRRAVGRLLRAGRTRSRVQEGPAHGRTASLRLQTGRSEPWRNLDRRQDHHRRVGRAVDGLAALVTIER